MKLSSIDPVLIELSLKDKKDKKERQRMARILSMEGNHAERVFLEMCTVQVGRNVRVGQKLLTLVANWPIDSRRKRAKQNGLF